ncbi:ATP-dependent zinc protease family protein [Pontibacter arcticus]|uniref:ATP-dependent zinc protease n=1 Tax=Pontibacter arcticus TaxID=2080288 RepID=A0A364RCX7_9BACT|nr:RimK/LysX family protein [Pontibacter arcticus]RAU82181.1 ATP-dependent zinc protease [Pontibacter arcticus]
MRDKKEEGVKPEKKVIGRREHISLPELDLQDLEAKIDTGAYTSAIHCSDIHTETMPDGTQVICVDLLDPSHPKYNHRKLRFAEYDLREIKSSFGEVQQRYIIRTTIELFNEVFEAEFSLSDRSDMKYPVLIGRKLLKGRYIVDISRKDLSRKYKSKQKQKQNNP